MSLLSGNATKAMAALIASVAALLAVFPTMVIQFIKGLVAILGEVVKLAPRIVSGLVTIAGDLLDGIVKLAPKIATTIGVLVTQILKILTNNTPKIIKAGATLIENLLTGLANNIPKIIPLVAKIITEFLNGLANNIGQMVTAGANLLVHFLNGIANNLGRVLNAAGNIIAHIITGLGNVLWKINNAGGEVLTHLITGMGKNLEKVITAGGDAIAHFITGVGKAGKKIITAGTTAAGKFINALVDGIVKLADTVYKGLIRLLNGLADTINKNTKPLNDAGWNLAWAMIHGITTGIGSLWGHLLDYLWTKVKSLPNILMKALEALSPSRVTMRIGGYFTEGLLIGIQRGFPNVDRAVQSGAQSSIKKTRDAFSQIPDILGNVTDVQPKITPVLDLSAVRRDAPAIADMLPSSKITAKLSTEHAKKISDQQESLASDKAAASVAGTTVTLNQSNYSPDPLPAIEIYRQTKNQLAQVKSLVGAA
jgi:hypothetical protein